MITDQLKQTREEWERTFNAIPDPIAIIDTQYCIVHANRVMAERLGIDQEACVGQTCYQCVHGMSEPLSFCPHSQLLKDGQEHVVEVYEERLGGYFLVSVSPLFDPSGQLTGSVHVAHDITERKQAEEALKKEQQILRQLLDSHDRDRQLIAYEIHDGLAQELAAANMQLQAAEQLRNDDAKKASELFQVGMALLTEGLRETRQLISGLRPPVLDKLGVVAAIENLVEDTRAEEEMEIELITCLKSDRLTPLLENTIFRIVQESLTNARKHSQSNLLRLELVQEDDLIRIEIRDWGIGFDPNNVTTGCFGLQGIQERARLLGGEAAISSNVGEGTRIVVELPVVEQ